MFLLDISDSFEQKQYQPTIPLGILTLKNQCDAPLVLLFGTVRHRLGAVKTTGAPS